MDYDVLILGGGIIGCAVAYELSKYNINIALIEKDYDIANDISVANTAIVYDGSEASNNKMASLEERGMNLIKDHCKKFDIKYNKIGLIRPLLDGNRDEIFHEIYDNFQRRGIKIINDNEIRKIEPNLKINTNKALYNENIAIISPYNLAVSYAEIAVDNGVNFRVEEKVIDISTISKGFRVTTNKNKFTCKFVINTIPNEIYNNRYYNIKNEIKNKNMKCIILKHKLKNDIGTIVINNIDKDNFVMNIPMSENESIICIKSNNSLSLNENSELLEKISRNVKKDLITNIFTETYNENNMFIDDSNLEEGYIQVIGNHYAKITISPAIAQDIGEKIKVNMNITEKKDYIDKKRDIYVFRNMSRNQINKIISLDKRYGNIICNCNNVSEGEIVDSIRRPLGARTVEGVKRRTGIGTGNCNGSNCNIKIIKILAREMNKSVLDIVDDSMNSRILVGRIKEFYEI